MYEEIGPLVTVTWDGARHGVDVSSNLCVVYHKSLLQSGMHPTCTNVACRSCLSA